MPLIPPWPNINHSNCETHQKGADTMPREVIPAPSWDSAPGRDHAELSSDLLDAHGHLIDLVINFAFETLGASRVDLRVTPHNPYQSETHERHTRTQLPS